MKEVSRMTKYEALVKMVQIMGERGLNFPVCSCDWTDMWRQKAYEKAAEYLESMKKVIPIEAWGLQDYSQIRGEKHPDGGMHLNLYKTFRQSADLHLYIVVDKMNVEIRSLRDYDRNFEGSFDLEKYLEDASQATRELVKAGYRVTIDPIK